MSDTVDNQNNTPAPGSPEHDAAMASKFDSAQGDTPPVDPPKDDTQGGTEELIAGKFKTVDEVVKAYKELEAKLGSKDTQEGDKDAQDGHEPTARDTVEKAGLDFNALSDEYNQHGELKPESYEALEKAGIPKEVVDMYIAGRQALVERLQLTAYSVAGGEENYSSMVKWAQANMSADEIATFNKAVGSNNPDVIKMAVLGLKGRYEVSNGSEPNLASGDTGEATGSVFESWAQVREAMRDPRYAKDPAYRREVENKLARSNPSM